ncbi:MAG: alpha/beta fold hydrolase [Gammaproteobacteria bacterium]|jgi:predicted alpha/beta-hydrolase family hydrolase|nr:alpha/beta hydrolase [Chromatiales bacterium]MCP4926772.1 lysophospholipase [Gammaproteobacteria bacterium]MDP7153807.1 alpha/beta fold hydrolase [Gammaproteobacteria bacterium]MDP7295939.1 alpha/beta fold hydrolase [Gammaproteobacteria bacterium]MDP7419288.1 alpha/beta fold hydrolase [Gammaproteobacteria bacterium]
MTIKLVCFSHGQESGPWGTKICAMADVARAAGWKVESLDYQGIEDARVRADQLVEYCRSQGAPIVLVGSSMGGYVATAAASRVGARGLFLLAPALYMPGYGEYMPDPLPDCPTMIVHGWRDDVVPHAGSIRYGNETGASVILLESDHRLTASINAINRLFSNFLTDLEAGDGL